MPKSLDPDQTQHFVAPDLDPNCFQSLSGSGEDTGRQRSEEIIDINIIVKLKLLLLIHFSNLQRN